MGKLTHGWEEWRIEVGKRAHSCQFVTGIGTGEG